MFFFSSCIPLLGVLCLLFATSTYGNIDCPAIKRSVDSILTIGPWNNDLAILTTDLQLFQAKMLENPPRLQLSSPQSLAVLESKLYGVLHGQSLSASANLIQVNSQMEPLVLLADKSGTLGINPSNGDSKLNPELTDFLSGAVWLSSLTGDFYAFTSNSIQSATMTSYLPPKITVQQPVNYLNYTDNNVQTQTTSVAGNWQIKKAFTWQQHFFVLTTNTVYSFEESVISNKGAQVLRKIPYEQFFNCTLSKEEEKETTIVSKKTKEEKSKTKVTRAHAAHSTSHETPVNVITVVFIISGVLFFLAFAVTVVLCIWGVPKKKAPSKGGQVNPPGSISFETKVTVPKSPKASPLKMTKTAVNSSATKRSISPTKQPGVGLRVATKMDPEMVKKIATRKALKRASSGALKVKGESSRQVKSATAIKTK